GTSIPRTGIAPGDLVVIVGNLVDNAIDAAADAPAPRWVEVGGRALDGELIVEVADSGAGLQSRGLGLALVEGTIRRLRGSIEVRRAPGALFAVRLPVPGSGPERTVEPTGETR
ncbi:MAG: GHKL domain-containing protein, partial [Cellulomonas sp.]|nr:GHKL domain-containing protein [Cellulomonas sp.]